MKWFSQGYRHNRPGVIWEPRLRPPMLYTHGGPQAGKAACPLHAEFASGHPTHWTGLIQRSNKHLSMPGCATKATPKHENNHGTRLQAPVPQVELWVGKG